MAQGNTVIVPGLSEAEDVPRGHSEKRIVNDQAMFRHQKETATTLSEQHGQSRLIRRVVQGDQEAFAELVQLYGPLLLRTASLIVGDRATAEDVVQEALIQAWLHLSELRVADALRSWLLRIVVTTSISLQRKRVRWAAFLGQSRASHAIDYAAQAADDAKGRRERDWDLAQAVERLPEKQRVALVLHYYHGMTVLSIAQVLRCSENTVKKRLQAALHTLRRVSHHREESNAWT